MKKTVMMVLCILMIALTSNAQGNGKALGNNHNFTGAKATKKKYQAIYQLDTNDPKIIEKAIRNINNALTDPRLEGKVEIELVAFGGGTDAYMKGGKYEDALKALVEKGVIVSQCNNTLRERKITPDQLYDFISIVPSGNGELIIRQADGWSVIKP